MPVLAEYNPRPHRPTRTVHALGQLAGLVLAALLLWLHGVFGRGWVGASLDFFFPLTLGCWAVCLVLMVMWVPGRFAARPGLALLVPLVPGLAGLGASVLVAAQVPQVDDARAGCDLLVMTSYLAERVRAAGLLASGSMLLGALAPLGVWTDATRRSRWPLFAAGLAAAGSVAWLFLDAALPSRAEIGGPAVRGLWVAAAAVGAWWIWARELPLRPGPAGAERPVAATATAVLGVVSLGCAMVAVHRAAALHALAYLEQPPGGATFATGVVASTALLRTGPLLLAGLAFTACLGLARGKRRLPPRVVAILVMFAGLATLAAGYEAGWRGEWKARCGSLLGADLELPRDRFDAGVAGEGARPVLVVGDGGAAGQGQPAKTAADRSEDVPRATAHGGRLLLAADRRLTIGRLEETLRDCGRAGWHRFGLLVRPAGQTACIRQRRVAGVCLDEHPGRLRHLPFETTHLDRRMRPPPGVVANLVVEPGQMEISFGGFGADVDVLASLGRMLPDRNGRRNLAGLLQALAEAKRRFPQSTTLLIQAQPAMTIADLGGRLGRIRTAGATPAFSTVRLAPLLR